MVEDHDKSDLERQKVDFTIFIRKPFLCHINFTPQLGRPCTFQRSFTTFPVPIISSFAVI
jgi:hypothetical protein